MSEVQDDLKTTWATYESLENCEERIILTIGHTAMMADILCDTRSYLVINEKEEIKIVHNGPKLGAVGALHVPLITKYKVNQVTLSHLSIDIP